MGLMGHLLDVFAGLTQSAAALRYFLPAAAAPTKCRRRWRLAASTSPLEMQEGIGGIQRPG